jgi:hypothetical protein
MESVVWGGGILLRCQYLQYTASINELERIWKEAVVIESRNCFDIHWGGLRKTTKTLKISGVLPDIPTTTSAI